MNITENHVSFETAKLLKEKGFNEKCRAFYNDKTLKITYIDSPISNEKPFNLCLLAPTLQMAMKWLREVHNIFICILPSEVGAGVMDYTYVLYRVDAKNFYFEDLGIQGRVENVSEISPEKVCEEAIKYCMENLI